MNIIDSLHIISAVIISITVIGVAIGWLFRKVIRPIYKRLVKLGDLIEMELQSNGGNSLKDTVDHISNTLKVHITDSNIHMRDK